MIIAIYRTLNHRLAIEIGRWSIIPISRDTGLCHFCSYNIVESEAHYVLECPLYDPIRDKFPSLVENVVLGSLKSFFQMDHQDDISLFLLEATAFLPLWKFSCLKPPLCTFNPIVLFNFLDIEINFISFHFTSWT